MSKKERIDKLTEIQQTNKSLEKICEMLDPEFLQKIRDNDMNDNGISSLEYIHENLDSWIKNKKA